MKDKDTLAQEENMSGNNSNEKHRNNVLSMIALFVSIVTFIVTFYIQYNVYHEPLPIKIISVQDIIDSQKTQIDKEIRNNDGSMSEAQVQKNVDKYTQKISSTLEDYAKKNKVLIIEKGAIVSNGLGAEDITEAFIKAIQ